MTLYDAELNKTVDITSEDYTFQSDATGGVNSSRFTLTFKTTGVVSIENGQLTIDNEAGESYDLQGRKVNGQSSMVNGQLKKGVYIQKGKKVVRK